jgi:hypothetical protein
VFDFGAGLNASNVNYRHYSGGVEIENMGAGAGAYNMSLEGHGQLIINANCSATSTVAIRGHFTVTDNAGGAVTLSDDARFDVDQINEQIDASIETYHLDHLLAADYNPASKPGVATALLNELIEDDGAGASRYTAGALAEAPSGAGGDATEANQTLLLEDLADIKGTGFVKDTDSLIDLAHTGADSDTLETLSDQMDAVGGGAGAITFVYTLTATGTGLPIADADVWVTSDLAGLNILGSGRTTQNGKVTFYLDAGTVYVWRQKSGWNFTNPDTEVVS